MTHRMALGTAIALALSVPSIAGAQDLLVFDYSGFEEPSFHQPFIDTHGAAPEFVFFGDEDEGVGDEDDDVLFGGKRLSSEKE